MAPTPSGHADLATLIDLFERLEPAGRWRILALAATPSARPAIDLTSLLTRDPENAGTTPHALKTLRALAENTLEITDALIVRPRTRDPLTSAPHDPAYRPGADDVEVLAASAAAIARAHSGPWRLWLPDPWLSPFALTFPGSRELEPATSSLTT